MSVGCALASIMFAVEPLSKGDSNTDQFDKDSTNNGGTGRLMQYLRKYGLLFTWMNIRDYWKTSLENHGVSLLAKATYSNALPQAVDLLLTITTPTKEIDSCRSFRASIFQIIKLIKFSYILLKLYLMIIIIS